jgi:hypothetical protein
MVVANLGRRICVSVALALLLATAATAQTAPSPETAQPSPKTTSPVKGQLLMVTLDALGTTSAALTYHGEMPLAEAQEDLNEIARLTGWKMYDAELSTSKVDNSMMTSVAFAATNAIPPQTGGLPVEPLIIALKRLKSLELVFVMQPDFKFHGLRDYDDRYVRIRLRNSGQTYSYNVDIKRDDFTKLGLPVIVEPEAAVPQTPKQSNRMIWPILISLSIGTSVWLIAHFSRKRKTS